MIFIKIIFFSILARFLNPFIKTKTKHWIFGAYGGKGYQQGSKYLFEYVRSHYPEVNCSFVVRERDLYYELLSKEIPVIDNLTFRGVITILQADAVFYSNGPADIFFAYKKNNRKYYHLTHGQGFKRQQSAINPEIRRKSRRFLYSVVRWLFYPFLVGHRMKDSSFIPATSEFTIPFLKKNFGKDIKIKILGLPRNDALFQDERMKSEIWLGGVDGKFIITYMPTHRLYGQGKVSPVPFANNLEAQKWMQENDVILLVKQHPNMMRKMKDNEKEHYDTIIDITKCKFDPQVIIWHTDVLVSDYSSIWLDFLLLKRPMIHYFYDDFEKSDVGLNIDMRKDAPGVICSTEEKLFELIKNIKNDYNAYIPSPEIVKKFYKFPDGRTCERYSMAVLEDLYG